MTLLFIPETNYVPGEVISVSVKGGIHSQSGEEVAPVRFSFTVSPLSKQQMETLGQAAAVLNHQSEIASETEKSFAGPSLMSKTGSTTIPAAVPLPAIKASSSPTPGAIFLSTMERSFYSGWNNRRPFR